MLDGVHRESQLSSAIAVVVKCAGIVSVLVCIGRREGYV